MPDQDYHDRLQRIADKQPPGASLSGNAPASRAAGPNTAMMVVAVIVIFIGSGLVKFANENYELLKADGGVGLAIGTGLGAIAALGFGITLFWRSLRTRQVRSFPAPQTSGTGLRVALFGLVLGGVACIAMIMADAARLVNPAPDNVFSGLAILTALALTLLAVVTAFVGLVRRGSALRRTPLFFIAGAMLIFAAFRLLDINLTDWPGFVALVE